MRVQELFESLGLSEKVAEARVDLAICYWREGALDEARVTLRLVLDSLQESQSEQRLRALLNSAIVESTAIRRSGGLKDLCGGGSAFRFEFQ